MGTQNVISSLRLKHLKDNGIESLSAPPIASVRKALSQMERIAVGDVIHVLVDLDQEEVEEALVVEDIEPALHDAASIGDVAWSVMIKTDGPSNGDGAASEAARLLRDRQQIGGGGGRHENTFLSPLSPTRLNGLKVGDQVDHRDKV